MKYDKLITENLNNVLVETDYSRLGDKYVGKVRDCYFSKDVSYLITTDRLSAFDRILTTIPFKGQVITEMAMENFKLTADIIENHLIDHPDPNVMLVKQAQMVPVEVVVRGYLAGSAILDYQAGREISGVKLPVGLKAFSKFAEPLITPSTKAPQGDHDLPISEKEIIRTGLVPVALWQELREKAIALFQRGQQIAKKKGLILVDTKYEFGIYQGKLILADEIHTLDSSRYWEESSYEEAFASGSSPIMLDKQNVRAWLLQQGFNGEGPVPTISDEYRKSVANLYLSSFARLMGRELAVDSRPIHDRIRENLKLAK